MKKENKEFMIDMGFITLMLVCGLAIGWISHDFHISNASNKVIDTTNCSNLTLSDTAQCLKNELKTFFRYNITNVNKDLTLEQLKASGGVCWHYADWYNARLKSLGYYSTEVHIDTNQTDAHKFTVSSNKDGYCILDQMYINCVMFPSQ